MNDIKEKISSGFSFKQDLSNKVTLSRLVDVEIASFFLLYFAFFFGGINLYIHKILYQTNTL